jgi:type VI secretion system VasD/TssJ family lipoprotein
MFGGTSKTTALKELKWTYAADGVQIAISADPALNRSGGQAHTLALTIVQLATPTAFTAYSSDSAKLKNLLLANGAPSGVLSLQRVFINPGEQRTVTMPRAEQAQYVGLAAGYYHLDAPRSTRLYRIGVGVDSSGFFLAQDHKASPEPLKIDLHLGADGILYSPGSRMPPIIPTQPQAGIVTSQSAAPAQTQAVTPRQ